MICLLTVFLVCSAHVGSPDVWYDGPAGPYSIRVLVRPPKVVPGLADIMVRVRGGAQSVRVAPARWDTGAEGTPPPDSAQPVRGDPELYHAQLWLMARGAYRIVVTIDGVHGPGTTIVPVMATAEQRFAVPYGLSGLLISATVFLFFGLITLVGAAVRESVLAPGDEPGEGRKRGARVAMLVAVPVAVLLLFGGWMWWNAVDNAHRELLDRPWDAMATATGSSAGSRLLTLEITDTIWTRRHSEPLARRFPQNALLPDHGKLMHMFLVREGDLAGFAHVHPVTRDSVRFTVALPSLPAGNYHVFADLVHESGATHTIVARATLADSSSATGISPVADLPAADPDDAAWTGPAVGTMTSPTTTLASGATMRWSIPQRIRVEQETDLTVEVVDAQGAPVPLETYMGMPAHAMIQKDDGSVFVHLHPMGTISMAAQQALRVARDKATTMSHGASAADSRVTFPYAFPKPGRYRVWIQVQQNGRVMTGAHDLTVIASE
ncbi:MAG: hypothetical protein WEE89_07930 [Gemmatimonadota bacterium]